MGKLSLGLKVTTCTCGEILGDMHDLLLSLFFFFFFFFLLSLFLSLLPFFLFLSLFSSILFLSIAPSQPPFPSPLSSPLPHSLQVNIIPVIAKADTISRSELSQFKARVSLPHTLITTSLGQQLMFAQCYSCPVQRPWQARPHTAEFCE